MSGLLVSGLAGVAFHRGGVDQIPSGLVELPEDGEWGGALPPIFSTSRQLGRPPHIPKPDEVPFGARRKFLCKIWCFLFE